MSLQLRIALRWTCAALAGLILGFLLVSLAGHLNREKREVVPGPQGMLVQAGRANQDFISYRFSGEQRESCSASPGCSR